jgi:hypothetical protein
MSKGINQVIFPDGRRLVRNCDDTNARAVAVRLGLYADIMAQLKGAKSPRGVAGMAVEGDQVVAIIAWAGFKRASDNGWGTLSMSPVREDTTSYLVALVQKIIGGDTWQMLQKEPPCHN